MQNIFYSLPIFPVHILFILFSFIFIIYSDFYGSRWIFGKVEKLEKVKLDNLHKQVFIGLLGLILTGVILSVQRPWVLESINFKIKMTFVLILFINSFIIGSLMKLSLNKSFINLSKKQKTYIIASGVVSTMAWLGAILSAITR